MNNQERNQIPDLERTTTRAGQKIRETAGQIGDTAARASEGLQENLDNIQLKFNDLRDSVIDTTKEYSRTANSYQLTPFLIHRIQGAAQRRGGLLLSGVANPVYYLFGTTLEDQQTLTVRYAIPYSDLEAFDEEELQQYMDEGTPLEFGHSLTDLIGGQTDAGFAITGFYEDICPDSPISKYHPSYIATRAVKL